MTAPTCAELTAEIGRLTHAYNQATQSEQHLRAELDQARDDLRLLGKHGPGCAMRTCTCENQPR